MKHRDSAIRPDPRFPGTFLVSIRRRHKRELSGLTPFFQAVIATAFLLAGLSPLPGLAGELRVQETVFLKLDADVQMDGAKTDARSIPVLPEPLDIQEIDGDWLSLDMPRVREQHVMTRYPGVSKRTASLGKVRVRKQHVMRAREAVEYYTDQVRQKPDDVFCWRSLGCAWEHANAKRQYEHAIKAYTEAIRLEPDDVETYLARASAWRYQGKPDRAIQDYSEVIRLRPKDASVYGFRANAWHENGGIDEQLADLTSAIRLDPKDAKYYCDRGDIWIVIGDVEKHLNDYAEVVRLCEAGILKEEDYLYIWRALAWLRATWPDDRYRDGNLAVEYARKLFPAKPEPNPKPKDTEDSEEEESPGWEDFDALAAAYAEAGNFPKAIESAEQALKEFQEQYSNGYTSVGRVPLVERLALYRSKKPCRDPNGYNVIAWLKATTPHGQYRDGKKAVELATTACELTAWKNWEFLDTLAAGCAETADFKAAVQWQEKAIGLAPEESKRKLTERLKLYQSQKPYREPTRITSSLGLMRVVGDE